MKFAGVDSIDDAQLLVGFEIQIPASERARLETGAAFVSELIGCEVFASEAGGEAREVGKVRDVQFGAGEAPLLVIRQETREVLIPLAEAYVRRLNPAARVIELEVPEGMLELDAPLSVEEKQAQKRQG